MTDNSQIESQINKIFAFLASELSDIQPFLKSTANVIKMRIDDNFQDGGRWSGSGSDVLSGGAKKWKPLKPSTLARYKSAGIKHFGTLDNTGTLRKSVDVSPISKSTIRISAGTDYGAIHQFGGTVNTTANIKSHKRKISQAFGKPINPKTVEVKAHSRKLDYYMPPRPFITLTQSDLQDIVDNILAMLIV